MIRELRKFEDELLDEAQSLSIESGLDDLNPNSNIEELFAAAAKLKCYLFNNITTAKDRWNALRHSLPTAQLRSILVIVLNIVPIFNVFSSDILS